MTSRGGYTHLYREVWDWPIFKNWLETAVFIRIVNSAQWNDFELTTKWGPVMLHRGELVVSERHIADRFNVERKVIQRLLKQLVDAGLIAIDRDRAPHRVGAIVAVLNYQKYQGFGLGEMEGLGHSHSASISAPEVGPKVGHSNPISVEDPGHSGIDISVRNQHLPDHLTDGVGHSNSRHPNSMGQTWAKNNTVNTFTPDTPYQDRPSTDRETPSIGDDLFEEIRTESPTRLPVSTPRAKPNPEGPPTPKDILWQHGRPLVAGILGTKDMKRVGSFIGKLRGLAGNNDIRLLQIIQQVHADRPIGPEAYLMRAAENANPKSATCGKSKLRTGDASWMAAGIEAVFREAPDSDLYDSDPNTIIIDAILDEEVAA